MHRAGGIGDHGHYRGAAAAAPRHLRHKGAPLLGPKGSPKQAGGPLMEWWVAARSCCKQGGMTMPPRLEEVFD